MIITITNAALARSPVIDDNYIQEVSLSHD